MALVVLLAAGALARSWWLPALGYALVRDDGPARADLVVVLAGDTFGHRVLKGAELVRQSYAPAALVSGPYGFYGSYESDLAIPFAVRHGYPREYFIPFPNQALSTRDEADLVLAELRRRNVRSFLLVTSDYHTARAARVFRAALRAEGGGPAMRVVSAADEYFRPDSWWRTRQAQKTFLTEWCKTFASAFGV
ncbi:MAG: YdcF family protein [Bryobacteraceae bacterium]